MTPEIPQPSTNRGRLHGLDFTRGLACLSMPIFHTVYNLYSVGLIDTKWTKHLFWEIYQVLGLSTFVFVSGAAFTLSTQRGIYWQRILKRALKLGAIALVITLATYLIMPDRFIRFGVIHFFTITILLAPFLRSLSKTLIVLGVAIATVGILLPEKGVYPNEWLYITGLMSNRPPSLDYIPLIPWFGVFIMGMWMGHWLPKPTSKTDPTTWMRPVIWLGKHSLAFYLIHQVVIYGILWLIAYLLK